MINYDYKKGKQRVQNILSNFSLITEFDNYKIPNDSEFTYDNMHRGWVTSVFVTINSFTKDNNQKIDVKEFFQLSNKPYKKKVVKIIRSFTSEVIGILHDDDLERDIGIREDCIFAIYTSPLIIDERNILDKVFKIKTYIKLLNELLQENNIGYTLDVNIGMSTDVEVVVKAGRKRSGVNNSVWIGEAVTKASNLSHIESNDRTGSIFISDSTHKYISEAQKQEFTEHYNGKRGTYYCNKPFLPNINTLINSERERAINILRNTDDIETLGKISKAPNHLTFANGLYTNITAVFVDIRSSTELFANKDKYKVAKIIRSFTSEVIEILRNHDNESLAVEIDIRGDCVYAIYSTPKKENIQDVFMKVCEVNTYIKMLKILLKYNLEVGIGMSTDPKELVIKAGKKGTGINNAVWIGEAVIKASSLSSLGGKDGFFPIVISNDVYSNLAYDIQKVCHQNVTNDCYISDVKVNPMNNWIDEGMPE